MEDNKRTRIVIGCPVETETREFVSANILEVEVGTTGHCGGDTGHGCRTFFRLKNLSSTDMRVDVVEDIDDTTDEVSISFGGDTELDTFLDALTFAVEKLRGYVK